MADSTHLPGPSPYKWWDCARGNRIRRQSPCSCPPRPTRWDSRTTRALRTHTPSSGRSTARPPPPWSWLGRDRLGALDRPEPRLRGGSLSFGNILRQRPAGAVKVYTSKVYCWIGLHAIEEKRGYNTHSFQASPGS